MPDKKEYCIALSRVELQTLVATTNACRDLTAQHAPELRERLECILDHGSSAQRPHAAVLEDDYCEACGLDSDYWAQLPTCPVYQVLAQIDIGVPAETVDAESTVGEDTLDQLADGALGQLGHVRLACTCANWIGGCKREVGCGLGWIRDTRDTLKKLKERLRLTELQS